MVRLVKVTRKPKQPPPLQVGDEVVVRGKVVNTGNGSGPIKITPHDGDDGWTFWVRPQDLERVKP
jgi:hypothetical protein